MKLHRSQCRHDTPYDAQPAPAWWPVEGTVALISGLWRTMFPQLEKLFGRRRAAIALLEIIFTPEKFK